MFRFLRWVCLWALCTAFSTAGEPKVIHVFVALCDNATQGIVPVPAKIGNGDDLVNNLYWGCDDAIVPRLKKSKAWKTISNMKPADQDVILSRAVFRHPSSGTILVADAYRGREIRSAIRDYFSALAGRHPVKVLAGDQTIHAGDRAGLIAYIGHNGLMEFPAETAVPVPEKKPSDAIAFCCMSRDYFRKPITSCGGTPRLLTTQLMYPGGFLLESAAESWIAGGDGTAMLGKAAAAYAKNQGISLRAAKGVFASGDN